MIDLMVEVLTHKSVHLRAAKGYTMTAVAVDLDAPSKDPEITREAGEFWRERGMRDIINKEVAIVRAEVAAGRLGWSYKEVEALLAPYPVDKEQDRILELCRDARHCDGAEARWLDAGGEEGDPATSDSDESNGGDDADGGATPDAGAQSAEEGGDGHVSLLEGPQSRAGVLTSTMSAPEAGVCHESQE